MEVEEVVIITSYNYISYQEANYKGNWPFTDVWVHVLQLFSADAKDFCNHSMINYRYTIEELKEISKTCEIKLLEPSSTSYLWKTKKMRQNKQISSRLPKVFTKSQAPQIQQNENIYQPFQPKVSEPFESVSNVSFDFKPNFQSSDEIFSMVPKTTNFAPLGAFNGFPVIPPGAKVIKITQGMKIPPGAVKIRPLFDFDYFDPITYQSMESTKLQEGMADNEMRPSGIITPDPPLESEKFSNSAGESSYDLTTDSYNILIQLPKFEY